MKKRLLGGLLVGLVLLAGGVFNVLSQSPEFTYYLPVVFKQATFTPTLTFTPTFTSTPTKTFTPTFTFTPTYTATPTKTFTPSPSPTASGTATSTPVTSPPLWSRTAYINTDGGQIIYELGCAAGTRDKNTAGKQDSVVVLDFGSPNYENGNFGTSLFGIGFLRTSEIALRVQTFAQGYYVCSGTDNESQMTIGIGTTNYGSYLTQGSNAYDHGRAWALMVNDVNSWIIQNGYASQVTAVGADDIELAWNSPTVSKAWVDGYDAVNLYDMYDYGAAEGCPTRSSPTITFCFTKYDSYGNIIYRWYLSDVWYVAYGTSPAYPLPLIYADTGINARQWSWLSRWSLVNKGYAMDFVGSFTQCQACLQRTGDLSCPYLDNKPAEGWQQLYNELITDGVGQGIRWATDIFWLGDSAQVDPNLCNTTKSPLMGGSLEQRERLLATALNSMTLPGEMVVSLSEKLDITRSVIFNQRNSPTAEKIAPVSFPDMGSPAYKIGIFEGDEGLFRPWQVQISNRWQGWDGEVKVQVLAGTQSADTAAGVIFVWRSDGSDDWQAFPAPVGLGGLRILSAAGDELVLQAESGSPVVFNWKTGAYLTDSDRH